MTARASAVAIIPVRLESQRLPRKALLNDSGQPLFLHTWERARAADCFAETYIATDSDEVDAAARAAGAEVIRTSARPRTGSERCAEAAQELEVDAVVDIQGDWPEIDPEDLRRLTAAVTTEGAPTATLAVELRDPEQFENPNVVKVVRGLNGDAMYFSRAGIPYGQRTTDLTPLRHIGVYAFTAEALAALPELPSSGLAETESLEQLRLLENGITMRVLTTQNQPWGIETREDYEAFLQRLKSKETPRP